MLTKNSFYTKKSLACLGLLLSLGLHAGTSSVSASAIDDCAGSEDRLASYAGTSILSYRRKVYDSNEGAYEQLAQSYPFEKKKGYLEGKGYATQEIETLLESVNDAILREAVFKEKGSSGEIEKAIKKYQMIEHLVSTELHTSTARYLVSQALLQKESYPDQKIVTSSLTPINGTHPCKQQFLEGYLRICGKGKFCPQEIRQLISSFFLLMPQSEYGRTPEPYLLRTPPFEPYCGKLGQDVKAGFLYALAQAHLFQVLKTLNPEYLQTANSCPLTLNMRVNQLDLYLKHKRKAHSSMQKYFFRFWFSRDVEEEETPKRYTKLFLRQGKVHQDYFFKERNTNMLGQYTRRKVIFQGCHVASPIRTNEGIDRYQEGVVLIHK